MTTESPQDDLPQQDPEAAADADNSESVPVEEVDPLTAMQVERDQFRDQFLRMAAEMDNFRKRVNREREEDRKYSCIGLIGDLLPALDNLERAVDAASADNAESGILQGVQMVLKQFGDILARNGAEPIIADGEPFDPNMHEALQQRPTNEVPPMTVVQVLEKGFKLHERVIRPSKVIVSSAPPEDEA